MYSDIHQILDRAIQLESSDVHLVANQPPFFRIHGELIPQEEPPLDPHNLKSIIYKTISKKQQETFEAVRELDFSYYGTKGYHFRFNIHMGKGHAAATIRLMPTAIRSPLELGLPLGIDQLTRKRSGIVMATGTAGSGKTTTLTSLINIINNERRCKIITIEDPIEFVYTSNKSLIVQREVGADTDSFANALKFALRQDPDVVVIGEMRDLESISMALTTAETGHLVLTTLHSGSAVEAITRLIDVYPAGRQEQIRVQLGECLLAILGQILLPRKEGQGRVLAVEVLMGTMAVRNLIRRNALSEIRGHMESGGEYGMQTLEQNLSALVNEGLITKELAVKYAKFPKMLQI